MPIFSISVSLLVKNAVAARYDSATVAASELDQVLFGGFDGFDEMPSRTRDTIAVDAETLVMQRRRRRQDANDANTILTSRHERGRCQSLVCRA